MIRNIIKYITRFFRNRRLKKATQKMINDKFKNHLLKELNDHFKKQHETLKDETYELNMSDLPIERCTMETKQKIHKLVLADLKNQTDRFIPKRTLTPTSIQEEVNDDETWVRLNQKTYDPVQSELEYKERIRAIIKDGSKDSNTVFYIPNNTVFYIPNNPIPISKKEKVKTPAEISAIQLKPVKPKFVKRTKNNNI